MKLTKLAAEIAKREGKKSEVAIGNIREVIKVLTDIMAEEMAETESFDHSDTEFNLYEMSLKKAKKLKKKKK